MSRIETLHPSRVTADPAVQQRAGGLDRDWVAELAAVLEAGGAFDDRPVCFFDGAEYHLARGFHRHAAADAAGREIEFEVRDGGRRDAVKSALGDNSAQKSLPLRSRDIRRKLATVNADPEWSKLPDRQKAELVGCSHTTLSTIMRNEYGRAKDESKARYTTKREDGDGNGDGRSARDGADPGVRQPAPVAGRDPGDGEGGRDAARGGHPPADGRPGRGDRPDARPGVGVPDGRVGGGEPRDALGRVIPDYLRPAWDRGRELTDAAKEVTAALRKLKGLDKDEAVGGFLARRPLIRDRIEDAADDLRLESPYCVCPGCDGDGDSETCPSCAGKGYCTGSEYHDLHPALRDRAGSFKPGDAWEGDEPPPAGTPRAFVPPAPGLDALGEPIPARLRDVFADRSLTELADALARAGRRVKADRQWNPHLILALVETLATASHDVAGSRPYAVCRPCGGKGCGRCATAGFLPDRDKDELAAGRR